MLTRKEKLSVPSSKFLISEITVYGNPIYGQLNRYYGKITVDIELKYYNGPIVVEGKLTAINFFIRKSILRALEKGRRLDKINDYLLLNRLCCKLRYIVHKMEIGSYKSKLVMFLYIFSKAEK